MRWFKHYSDASDDAFIEGLEDKFGWEGYGRWWKLLEIIAKSMDKNSDPSAEHSWVKWQSLLKGKRNKLDSFLIHCQNEMKINLEQNGNILKINCPKLLELRDEYNRKSGHTTDTCQDKLPPKTKEIRTKKEEKEKDKKESLVGDDFSEFWKLYPKKSNRKVAEQKYNLTIKNGATHKQIMDGVTAYVKSDTVLKGYICNPETWFNQERWKTTDYTPTDNRQITTALPEGVFMHDGKLFKRNSDNTSMPYKPTPTLF